MSTIDQRILEVLAKNGTANATSIALGLEANQQSVRMALGRLRAQGAAVEEDGYWRATGVEPAKRTYKKREKPAAAPVELPPFDACVYLDGSCAIFGLASEPVTLSAEETRQLQALLNRALPRALLAEQRQFGGVLGGLGGNAAYCAVAAQGAEA